MVTILKTTMKSVLYEIHRIALQELFCLQACDRAVELLRGELVSQDPFHCLDIVAPCDPIQDQEIRERKDVLIH